MIIAIPSKGRAGKVTSHHLLGDAQGLAYLFVPEAEVGMYQDGHPEMGGRIVGVSDDIKGITPTRNFILKWCEDQGARWNLQVDDDAIYFSYFEANSPTPGIELADDLKVQLFSNFFVMCEDAKTNLFGFNVSGDKKFYREYSPFSFLSVVVGNLMGIVLGDGQRFDERLRVKEDYDFSLQSLYRYRRIIRSNKHVWRVQHHDTDGGCKDYRTYRTEMEAISTLRRKWGRRIVGEHFRKEYEIRVKVPIGGI